MVIYALVDHKPVKIKHIVVGDVIPTPTMDLRYEEEIRKVNMEIQKAARQAKTLKSGSRKVKITMVPLHKLVLERFKYFSLDTGGMETLVRIVRPHVTYFLADRVQLNDAGKQLLKTFLLKQFGTVTGRCGHVGRYPNGARS